MAEAYEWNWTKTYAKDRVICPYCGYVHGNSDEFGDGDGEEDTFDCERCGKEFEYVVSVTVDYTTSPKKEELAKEPCGNCGGCGMIDDNQLRTCPECNGSGKTKEENNNG